MNVGRVPAKWARLDPQRPAIFDSTTGRRITFGELDEMVRRLANGLRGLGLEQGDRVAILSQNSIEYAALYFACGRSGLIAQPLNWRLSAPELDRIIANGEPRVLITQDQFAPVAGELQRSVEKVEHWFEYGPRGDGSFERLVDAASDVEPPWSGHIGDTDPLFILYTGGTTGESKGALHTHRSAWYAMLNQTVGERIVPSDVYMLTGQMFHIPVVLAINYLAHGCPLVLMNFEPELAMRLIQEERVSAFLGVTTMLNWMMTVPNFESYDTSSIRSIMYGGGPMPTRVIREAMEAFPGGLLQGYGQTEGTTMAMLAPEDHVRAIYEDYRPDRLRSCGRETFVTTLSIVDADGNEVRRDGKTPGEIVVKSEANMVGYFGRPDLTAQTIRNGWMHTGDVATWDEDRYVTIVDRAKDMIISGGENIYSAQVEEAIAGHPAVLETAVIGVPDDEWGESVMAYVVLKPEMHATGDDIIEVARQNLASYQKPRRVEFVSELPKAPTGKILKRVLREPHWEGREKNV